ncbi:MAG: T9SS type A sorting domain-containing protein [Bacteroidetes bacterium]|nr:T9SS type A sorting domain-containing protein [Bacteroidota bacterium]
MKKLFATLALCIGICAVSFAQNNPMYFDSTTFRSVDGGQTFITPIQGTMPYVSPSDTALPCIIADTVISDTIYFHNFSGFSGFTVQSLRIDSIYLPAGLTWHTSSPTNTFTTGQDGVILINGATHVPAGVYKLRIVVSVDAPPISLSDADAEALDHLRYHVRVINSPYCQCPAIDPADSGSVYTAVNDNCGWEEFPGDTNGVYDHYRISNFSIQPNPFSNSTKIEFNATEHGIYTLKMTNLLGAVVASKEVEVYNGANELMLDRNGLSSGIYLLSISNDKGTVTRKVAIE